VDPSAWRKASIRTCSSAAAAGAGPSAAMRLEGGRHAAVMPDAFNVATAFSTSNASGAGPRRPKFRLTATVAFAGPRSVARAIAWERVGAGLGTGRGFVVLASGTGAWQAERPSAMARRTTRVFTKR